jgi:hypothetical protein
MARPFVHILCAAAVLLCTSAFAAKHGDNGAQAAYKHDLAQCRAGKSSEDRRTCEHEAQRAYAEARRGALRDDHANYDDNARARCLSLKAREDIEACEAGLRRGG